MELVLEMKEDIIGNRQKRMLSMLLVFLLVLGMGIAVHERSVVQMNTGTNKENVASVSLRDSKDSNVISDKKEEISVVTSDNETADAWMMTPEKEAAITPVVIPDQEVTIVQVAVPDQEIVIEPVDMPEKEITVLPEIMTDIEGSAPSEVISDEEIEIITEIVPDTEKEIHPDEMIGTEITVAPEIPEETVEEVVQMMSPFLTDEAGMIYDFIPEYANLSNGYLEIPTDGCVGIRRGAFDGCSGMIAEIMIPAGIVQIEDGALNEITSLEWITVAGENPSYSSKDGILFRYGGSEIFTFPPARVGAYFVPAEVTGVSANAFMNTSLSIIDTRACGLPDNCLLNISESCSIIE